MTVWANTESVSLSALCVHARFGPVFFSVCVRASVHARFETGGGGGGGGVNMQECTNVCVCVKATSQECARE